MLSFFDHTPDSWRAATRDWDVPRYFTDQLFRWVYQRGTIDPLSMTDLPLRVRNLMADHVQFSTGDIVRHLQATDGTQKLLIGWRNQSLANRSGSTVNDTSVQESVGRSADESASRLRVLDDQADRHTETVMIPAENRRTACISSQVGCPVGCRFCASGLGGLEANLRSGQIVEQVYYLNQLPQIDRITNIVFMGMGEPLANFQAVTQAIRNLNASWGMGVGARRITVSTVGLPHAIRKLVNFDIPVTLALSLHAPNDELRRQLIPWAEYTTISDLFDACHEYFRRTGREITLEYTLLGGVNDQAQHARELAAIASGLRANVNLIRYNEVAELPYQRPADGNVLRFQSILQKHCINTHIRASRGRDIDAACGQLKHEYTRAQNRTVQQGS